MLLNFLKVALRHLAKNKLYASLNLLGLAIAYAVVASLSLYILYETSFDSFHEKSHRIYRPTHHFVSEGGFETHWARTYLDYINELPEDIPEIEKLIRFQNHQRKYLRIGEEKFTSPHTFVTDPEVFSVFDFELVSGDPATALQAPKSVVLTESLARTYFGEADPLGKELSVVGDFTDEEVVHQVTGVMKDLPAHSHMPVEVLLSYQNPEERSWWAYIYVLLAEGATIEAVEAKMPEFMAKHRPEGERGQLDIEFQALEDIHLDSHLAREIAPNGDRQNVQVFMYVALFIFLIALINYLNLSSALAIGRGKEIGMRLILGASRKHLVGYALVESMLYHLVAALLGWSLVTILMPYLPQFIFFEPLLTAWQQILGIVGLAIAGGMLAGLYPAWVLTTFAGFQWNRKEATQRSQRHRAGNRLKKTLVGIQFATAVLLVASTWLARNQVYFLQHKQLGMNTEQVLAIPNIPNPVTDKYPAFRDRVSQIPGVNMVSACMEVPSREIRDVGPTFVAGGESDPNQAPMLDMQVISPGFIATMDIELLAGEDKTHEFVFQPNPQFSETYSPAQYLNEQPRKYMVNETAMKKLGWNDPQEAIGKRISWAIGGFELAEGPITAVIKDVHQETLKNQVDPTLLVVEQIWLRTFLLKLNTEKIQETMASVEQAWHELFPTYPLTYQFLDELYDQLYQQERTQLQLLISLSGLAIFLALLGLFSLIAYSLQTRLKELAIRRISGALLRDLIQLVSRDYLILLMLGSILAIPLSIWTVNSWLASYAYQTEVAYDVYGYTLAGMALLMVVIIGFQIFNASRRNPAEILREE